MIFGKIDFINLLPFHVFIKRYARSTRFHQSLHYHKGVPSALNREFAMRRINAAFISSITAKNCHHFGVGIVAQREVLSVLSLPNADKADEDSATSNLLAQILEVHGEVLIGDKALRYYYSGGEHIDLGGLWHERTGLPFVFALLCTHHHSDELRRLSRAFVIKKVKIPHYILMEASRRSGLTPAQIIHYLKFISYKVGVKEEKGYKRFVGEAKKRGLNPSLSKIRY
ncbi:MqnA/MqnD/SBP family protein [Sulfuricurvum sp.]|uniref:MqnA/MqnD/SBP family protein n=1 Tax=Sulfuricurvum sp. TaxID=2025608 RepID=UPI002E3177E6|nr:MqnA/MqnD/SBP family protein [Sulfuricurvum sp.]HEX5330588.1 MqnA/MqnD/SBP family protein [Sulfuricurvum sp.]